MEYVTFTKQLSRWLDQNVTVSFVLCSTKDYPANWIRTDPLVFVLGFLGYAHAHTIANHSCALQSIRAHLCFEALKVKSAVTRWTLPTNLGVPIFNGGSFFGEFMSSIGRNLGRFPNGPPLNDPFW